MTSYLPPLPKGLCGKRPSEDQRRRYLFFGQCVFMEYHDGPCSWDES